MSEMESPVAVNHRAGNSMRIPKFLNTSTLTFTPEEISVYYNVRVPKLRQTGKEWRGSCPVHNGENDSLAVDPETGRWFCHSTCGRGGDILDLETELIGGDFPTRKAEVFRLVGRSEANSFQTGNGTKGNWAGRDPSKPTEPIIDKGAWREIGTYPYVDKDGALLFEVVRKERGEGENRKKTFLQRKPDGMGGWKYNLNDVVRVPYRLPQVLNAETVYLPEGERDVHTLEAWSLVASCNSGGSGSSYVYGSWGEYFQGRHVVVLPDKDQPGRRHAAAVAESLLGTAASVRIVELPGLPDKGDVTDFRDAGGTLDQLTELTESAEPMNSDTLTRLRDRWGLSELENNQPAARVKAEEVWPEPEPIQSELPPVQPFCEELLPDSFRPLVVDLAERMQVPKDFPAVLIMLSLAGAVNRRARIQPKANDSGWVVVPNLWGAIVAPPGYLKSPIIQAVTRPLNQIQAEWRQEHDKALKDFAGEREKSELRHAVWKERYKKAAKDGKESQDRQENELQEPTLRRLVINDATFEALHQTMSKNPAGILVIRDELTGWWSQLDKTGREGERSFCLQAWNGDTAHMSSLFRPGPLRSSDLAHLAISILHHSTS